MNKPKLPCPLCARKHYTKQQVIDCMKADQKEEKAKNRKLKPIIFEEVTFCTEEMIKKTNAYKRLTK